MYKISCCSTVDMPAAFFKERNINLIYMKTEIDGKLYQDMGEELSISEFYNLIDNGAMPRTSQVNLEEYLVSFRPILEQGYDILHVTLSSGLSGTNQSANIAKSMLEEEFPDRKIYIVDSLGASSGSGLLLTLLSDMQIKGKEIDEVYEWAEENKLKINHWFFSNDLSHLRRGGRVSATKATFANLLNICPLMNMDIEGHLIPREKVRGVKKSLHVMLSKMEDLADNGLDYDGYCYIAHSDRKELSELLSKMIEDKFNNLREVKINDVGMVIGTHTGPGTVALFFVGKKRED